MIKQALCAKTLERCPTAEKCLGNDECARYDALDDDLPRDWLSPNWSDAVRVHDWRNYIPEPIQKRWQNLAVETRIVAACMAEMQAKNEHWD